jgi:hypothetical protein
MASINTNYGAAIALQNLNKTNSELERTQNRINTGLKVSSAKDSGAIFSIATSQRANAASQDAVRSTLQRTQSITDVALAAGDTITTALEEMKSLAVSIQSSAAGSSAGTPRAGRRGRQLLPAVLSPVPTKRHGHVLVIRRKHCMPQRSANARVRRP